MKRTIAITTIVAAAALVSACSSPEATPTVTPTVTSTPSPTPTPTEDTSGTYAFGETATIDYAGSVWAITLQAPVETEPAIAESFPLEDPSNRYVTVPGTIARVEGPPAEPITEVQIGVVVDNRSIDAEYLSTDGVPPLPAVDELFTGGESPFEEIFAVPSGSEVLTVSVIVGMGEAGQRVFFGEPVDLGASADTSSSPDVESMKFVWGESSPEQRAQTLSDLGLEAGGAVTDEAVASFAQQANEVGIILDDAEAREFLEWAVQQP